MVSFVEHGSVAVRIVDKFLSVQGSGPWNLEALVKAKDKYGELVEVFHGQPWGALIELTGDPIYVPDAADYLVQTIQQNRTKGCVASALVVAGSNSPEFAKRHLGELHSRANDVFGFFANIQQASGWLRQQIRTAI